MKEFKVVIKVKKQVVGVYTFKAENMAAAMSIAEKYRLPDCTILIREI
jgi:hypothetical protein